MPLDYYRVEKALHYLTSRREEQPSLAEAAAQAGLSEAHFQRLFVRWAGISPKKFLMNLTVEHAKQLLEESRPVLQTALESGLSGPGRLHDHFVALEAMTPGEYGDRGAGLRIRHSVEESPFGWVFIAMTDRGVCQLAFIDEGTDDEALAAAREQFPRAEWSCDTKSCRPIVNRIFENLRGGGDGESLSLHVRGTNFQVQVWRALIRIPPGHLTTYSDIANVVCTRRAARAVGNAVGANPAAVLIPCHRVIQNMGVCGNYRWGAARKQAILGWETAVHATL